MIPLLVVIAFVCCRKVIAIIATSALQVDDGLHPSGQNLMQAGGRTELATELDWCLQRLTGHPRLNNPALRASCQQSLPVDTCQAADAVLGEPPFSTKAVLAACRELSRAALGNRARHDVTLLSRGRVAVSSDEELDWALQRKKESQPFLKGPPYPKLVCTNMTKKTNNVTLVANVSMPNGSLPEGCWIWEDAYTTTTSTSTSTTTRNSTSNSTSNNTSNSTSNSTSISTTTRTSTTTHNNKTSKNATLAQLHASEGTALTPDDSTSAAVLPEADSADMSYGRNLGRPWMRLTQWPW